MVKKKNTARDTNIMGDRMNEMANTIEEKTASLAGLEKRLRFLAKDNNRKTKEIDHIEAEIKDLEEKHEASIDLLNIVHGGMEEEIDHETLVLRNEVEKLERQLEMHCEMEEENKFLAQERDRVMAEFVSNEHHHNDTVHETKNKIIELEGELENAFKKELLVMDAKHQHEAYEALHIKSKRALLENAKLSEEIVMQKIGLVNLTERMIIEDNHISTIGKHQVIERSERALRKMRIRATAKLTLFSIFWLPRLPLIH
tara:strand:- start:152 stop:922 length:771 start_codon:yes stop_codon:yes gene_type:complete